MFLPPSFVLPDDYGLFVEAFKRHPGEVWIMKPVGRAQGKGIFLFTKLNQISNWRKDHKWKADQPQVRSPTGGAVLACAPGCTVTLRHLHCLPHTLHATARGPLCVRGVGHGCRRTTTLYKSTSTTPTSSQVRLATRHCTPPTRWATQPQPYILPPVQPVRGTAPTTAHWRARTPCTCCCPCACCGLVHVAAPVPVAAVPA